MNLARISTLLAASTILAGGTAIAAPKNLASTGPAFSSASLSGLGARNIGSATMSGRIAAIAARAEADGKTTILVGAATGGMWKSNDGGTTFRPIFDKETSQSIGALALDPNHPDTYWAGTGESWMRNSVSVGDGVYKTVDGGETWANVGLPNSEHISKIIVDPSNSDTVYVCAPGRLWSDSADRGLYKTTDGGRTWALILKGPNLSTGCSTLALDPTDPKKLIAGLWDFRRKGWTFRSGGENADAPSGSGLFVTMDGGASWSELKADGANGLPKGPWGREAVAIAPSNPKIVYALIENVRSALYRSEDGGKTWAERDRSQNMVWRPFYFANLIVDPKNPDRVFKTDLSLIASEDGGKSFSAVADSTHSDQHAVWIDPTDTKHVITGNDGGLWISHDGGNRWEKNENLPVSQFYHVSVDDKDPYQVYGGLQDNSVWVGDSAYPGGITNGRWENLGGGDGFWAWPDPADPEGFAYGESQGGAVLRVNRKTLEARDIQPRSDTTEKLRWNWNTPLVTSPNEQGTIYIGAQYLYRSRDHGQSWDKISPDLTTNDKDRQKQEESGGITVDNSAAETYTTIYTISESPRQGGVIWVGTDDGNVQLTRDDGKTWTNLTAKVGMPAASWVSWIEASPYDAATAYAAFDRHSFGDFAPYIYKTTNFGQTWTRIASPQAGMRGFAHVIKEDPEKPGLLYAGTEFGLWVSLDGGGRWAQFKGGDLPDVPVRDMAFQKRDHDLAIATHGRGIWIVDDLTPLRAMNAQIMAQPLAFLPSRPAQQRIEANGGWASGDAQFVGDNPADGASIAYYEPGRHLFGKLKVEVLDASGKVVDTLPASKRPGINRVVWSMRAPAPRTPPAAQIAFNSVQGPRYVPGTYTARLTSGPAVLTAPVTVTLDRRVNFTLQDRQAQFDAAMKVSALFSRMTDLVARINAVRQGADARASGLPGGDALKVGLTDLSAKADVLRKEIVATKEGGAITGEERLREFTDQLYGAIMSYEGAPATYQLTRIDVLSNQLAGIAGRFDALASSDLAARNRDLTDRKLPPIDVPAAAPVAPGASGGGNPAKALAGYAFSLHPTAMATQAAAERD
ncbi:MAG: sialidase [Pseudomonadota bacterium]|nr:sialidase [Pseudomonadota bacterium]